jgi:hypothetical protein
LEPVAGTAVSLTQLTCATTNCMQTPTAPCATCSSFLCIDCLNNHTNGSLRCAISANAAHTLSTPTNTTSLVRWGRLKRQRAELTRESSTTEEVTPVHTNTPIPSPPLIRPIHNLPPWPIHPFGAEPGYYNLDVPGGWPAASSSSRNSPVAILCGNGDCPNLFTSICQRCLLRICDTTRPRPTLSRRAFKCRLSGCS